jgi:hypothetical protein
MFKYNAVELSLIKLLKKKAQKKIICPTLELMKETGYGDTSIKDALRVLVAKERIQWNTNARKKPTIKWLK